MRFRLLAAAFCLSVPSVALAQTAPEAPELVIPNGVDSDAFCFVALVNFGGAIEKAPTTLTPERKQSVVNLNNATTMYLVGVLSRRSDDDLKSQLAKANVAFKKMPNSQKPSEIQACLAVPKAQIVRVFDMGKSGEKL